MDASNTAKSWLIAWAAALAVLLAGCSPGTPSSGRLLSPQHADALTLRVIALPPGYLQVVSMDPNAAQLAQMLGNSGEADRLARDGRTGGTYRVFVYAAPEPSVLAIGLRIGVEIDFFATAGGARAWLSARQSDLAATAGPVVPFGGPGQAHVVRLQSYSEGGATDSQVVLAFIEANVYVEIATESIGPGPTTSDAETVASEIDHLLTSSKATNSSTSIFFHRA
jgi:hypothetical protein